MRILAIILYLLTAIAAALWFVLYMMMAGQACAFGSLQGPCPSLFERMDWSLFVLVIAMPGAIVAALLGGAIWAGSVARRRRRAQAEDQSPSA